MSIKSSASEWVRKGPSRAIAVIAAAGVLIGALIGFGVGYKIEQSRSHKEIKRLQAQIKTAGGVKPAPVAVIGQRVGKVTATAAGSFTVLTKLGGSQVLAISASTVYEKTARGAVAGVKVGNRVLAVSGGKEIIVLSATSKLGRVVGKVTKATIVLKAGGGVKAATIKKSVVKTVSTLQPATSADVTTGTSLIAGGRKTAQQTQFATIEIIVLPRGSAFAG